MKTDELIDRLAGAARPVAPLRPAARAGAWLLGVIVYLVALAALLTSPGDLAANGSARSFVAPQLAALLTGMLAAAAAFHSVIPGRSVRLAALAALAAVGWLVTLALGSGGQWQAAGVTAASHEWRCVAMIGLSGAPPALILVTLLRRGAPLHPVLTGSLAALAVASLANIGACVSEPHPSSAVTLVWHGMTVLVLVAATAAVSRRVFSWRQHRGMDRIYS